MSTLRPVQHMIICKDKHFNCFPNIVKRRDGSYYVGFRQAPDWFEQFGTTIHIDPTSLAVYMTSTDGLTWDVTKQHVLYDDFLYGVQDPSITMLKDGAMLCTFFMWKVVDAEPGVTGRDVYGKWLANIDKTYAIRSTDGGVTWDEPTVLRGGALRGNCVELDDGSILVASYSTGLPINKSTDRGKTWTQIALIRNFDGYSLVEPNLFRTRSGKIVCLARSSKGSAYPLVTAESLDNGKTWSAPVVHSYIDTPNPFCALQLADGNVLLAYGYRRKPYGIRAKLLNPECTNIAEAAEVILRQDGAGTDLGYPSAVQMDDGRILVAYYFHDVVKGPRYIAGTVCELV